jgi:hypothetical protein
MSPLEFLVMAAAIFFLVVYITIAIVNGDFEELLRISLAGGGGYLTGRYIVFPYVVRPLMRRYWP